MRQFFASEARFLLSSLEVTSLEKSMLQTIVGKIRGLAMAGALVSIGVGTGVANAAVYKTTWDPLFSTGSVPIADLGWSGDATIDVNSGCLVANSIQTPLNNPCGAVTLQVAHLNLFYFTSGIPITNFTWVENTAGPITSLSLDSSAHVNGMALALYGTYSPFDQFTDFALTFNVGSFNPDSNGLPTLAFSIPGCDIECVSYANDPGIAFNTNSWIEVPEPASLALVGAALAALGLSRRRRTR